MKHVAAQGVTAVHHMGTWDDLAVFERACARGPPRHAHLRRGAARHAGSGCATPSPRNASAGRTRRRLAARRRAEGLRRRIARLAHRGVPRAVHRRAARRRAGLLRRRRPRISTRWIAGADKAGLHVVVHAIGDRANATLLDIFERVARENGARDRRFRIEHAQHLAPADIPRFGALGVIASMQPYHAIDDGRWAEQVIGAERIKTTYAFRSLLDARRAARVRQRLVRRAADAARRDLRRRHAPHARRQASRTAGCRSRRSRSRRRCAPTRAAARTRRSRSATKGTIAPGMLADLTVIDRDLRAIPAAEIRDAKIVRTIVGGRTVFRE